MSAHDRAHINLDRSTQRLRDFSAVNAHLGDVVRFPAVDSSNLDLAELIRTEFIQPGILETYTAGHLGCALSHLALWSKAIATGAPLTICEDDAILHPDFELRAAELLTLLPADWDIILWGWNFDATLDIDFLPGISPCLVLCDQSALRTGISRCQQLPISPQPFPVRQAFGLPCYSVSPKGAQALREFCLPVRPMRLRFAGGDDYVLNVGIDCMMAGLYPDSGLLSAFRHWRSP